MNTPLAYHLTWTTYGTWLPGDDRGWVGKAGDGIQAPERTWREQAKQKLIESPVVLSEPERTVVQETIAAHCVIRDWTLHAINVRTNHVHLVVSAAQPPEQVLSQFKAWSSRRLNERSIRRERWWTQHGSTKWIFDEAYLDNAIRYVNEGQ